MKTTKEIMLNVTVMTLAVLASMTFSTTTLCADDDDDRYEHRRYYEHGERNYGHGERSAFKQNTGMQPMDPLYKKECGACHFAYQPGLLPKRSWDKMMADLADHFGTDASLEPADVAKIKGYLDSYAADSGKAGYRHYQKLNRSIHPADAPQRISEIPYFVKEHRGIPLRAINQDAVKSLAHCRKCHTTADKGYYGERGINIPGYGRWDD